MFVLFLLASSALPVYHRIMGRPRVLAHWPNGQFVDGEGRKFVVECAIDLWCNAYLQLVGLLARLAMKPPTTYLSCR